jgi:MFS family permease
MEVLWSVLTMLLATSKNFTHLVVIRFFVGMSQSPSIRVSPLTKFMLCSGLAESTFYPSIQYVIGSWYKPDELGKRACIFHVGPSIIVHLHLWLTGHLIRRPVHSDPCSVDSFRRCGFRIRFASLGVSDKGLGCIQWSERRLWTPRMEMSVPFI